MMKSIFSNNLILLTFAYATTATLTFTATAPAHSQEIEIPIGQQATEKQSMDRPVTGMSKDQVRSFFGDPQASQEPIGDPPISRWEYADFIVYFENNHVIHTVLRHNTEGELINN